jgi:ABC-type transporter MlaC component
MEYNINADTVSVKASKVVELSEYFSLITTTGSIDLRVEIKADFEKIPEEYHEVLLNMLTSKYINKVSFGHNPFSQCRPPQKKKWFQFWKKNELKSII